MARIENDVEILLNASVTTLQKWVQSRHLPELEGAASEFVRNQTWSAALDFVGAADVLVHTYVKIIDRALPNKIDAAEELLHVELGRVCMSGWMGAANSVGAGVAMGLVAELRRWLGDLKQSGNVTPSLSIREIHPQSRKAGVIIEPQAVAYVVLAALERHASEHRAKSYGLKLELIRSGLGLTRVELARLVGVSREGLRQWELGAAIGQDRWPVIDRLVNTVRGLTRFLKPEAVPAVVRRPIPSLSNSTPLDWLMSQRDEELLKFYERLFSYASTD